MMIRGIGFSGDGLICLCSIVGTSENFQDPPCVFEPGGTTFFSARDGAREDSRVLVSGVNETRFEDSAVVGRSTTTSSAFLTGVKKFARALILLGFGGDGFFCFFGGGSPAGLLGFFSRAFAAFSSIRAIRCNRFSSGVNCSSPALAFSVLVMSPVFSRNAFAAGVGSPPTVGLVTVNTSEGTPENVRRRCRDPALERCRDFTLMVSMADRTERPLEPEKTTHDVVRWVELRCAIELDAPSRAMRWLTTLVTSGAAKNPCRWARRIVGGDAASLEAFGAALTARGLAQCPTP
mgnify:CR=1 FL=1